MHMNLYRKGLFTTTALVAISLAAPAFAVDVVPATGPDTTLNTLGSTSGYNFIAGGDNSFNTGNTTAINLNSPATLEQIITLTGPAITVTAANANTIFITEDAASITIGAGNTLSNTGTGDTVNFNVDNSPAGFPAVININGILSNTGGGQAIDGALITAGGLNINLNNGGTLLGDVNLGQGTTNFVAANGSSFTGSILGSAIGGTDNITLGNGALTNAVDGGAGADTVTLIGGAHTNTFTNVESLILTGGTYTTQPVSAFATALSVGTGTGLNVVNDTTAGAFTFNGTTVLGATNTLTATTLAGGTTGSGSVFVVNAIGNDAGNITVANAGNANLTLSNTALNVLRDPNVVVANGTTNQIFTNSSAVGTSTLFGPLTDNSFVYDYAQSLGGVNGNDVILTTLRANTFTSTGENEQTRNVGQALETLIANGGTTDPQLSSVILNLDNMSSASQMNTALETLTPAVNGIGEASLATASASIRNIESRLETNRDENQRGVNSGDRFSSLKGAWLQGFGSFGDQDMRDNVAGYEFDTYGGAVGVDTERLLNGGLVGLAAGYANTQVDSKSANNGETDIDSYQVSLYASKTLSPRYHGIFVDGIATFAYNQYDTNRDIAVGGFAASTNGDYDGYQGSARVAVGKDYNLGKIGLFLTPEVSAQYTHLYLEDYTETGAGGASLNVGSDNMDALLFGAGGKLSYTAASIQGARIVPEVRARILYDVIGDDLQRTNTFTGGGPAFNTNGADIEQLSYNLGAGLKILDIAKNVSLSADYDAELKEDFTGHNVQARLRVDF